MAVAGAPLMDTDEATLLQNEWQVDSQPLLHGYIGLLGWKLRTRLSVSTIALPEFKVPDTSRGPIICTDIQCATVSDA